MSALVSLITVATLGAPAHAATYRADVVTSISDARADVTDENDAALTEPRADVTAASVEYRPGEIAFTLNVAQPTDPRTDANWVDGDSFALWALDTNADQDADFIVSLVAVDGLLIPGVVKPSNMEEVLCLGSGSYDGTSYGAVISSSCVGNPASFGWGAGMFYTANGRVAVDGVPDGDNFAGPITAPPTLDPTAGGYWLVGDDGGIFSFNAPFAGSTGAIKLNKPIVGMAADPDREGYWFVASDGGIFGFDAPFFGSTGAINLNKPIVGMAATPSGKGYWLVASDGGIFSFGDAKFYGAAVGSSFPVVGMASATDGKGYTIVRADGSVVNRGSSPLAGSLVGQKLGRPVVGIAATL